MNPIVYDVSMAAGLALLVAGVGMVAGVGAALIAAGAGVIGLTALGARR